MVVRTRFAPSPTGKLHLGGARTALYAWLYARHFQGEFILRFEDTDQARSTQSSVTSILHGLEWMGLTLDEGPFYQSQRTKIYQETLSILLNQGSVYYCGCSQERLHQVREGQMAQGKKPKYDGLCRSKNHPRGSINSVVRFKTPHCGKSIFVDQLRGTLAVDNQELDDFVLQRSDGSFTYQFTSVVDDIAMSITDVLRGEEHINSTFRQLHLIDALKEKRPTYIHLPLLFHNDGEKLSKRKGAVNILDYKANGFLPEAMVNYLVRLGWSCGNQEIFHLKELISLFSIDGMNPSKSILNPKKLHWINQEHLKKAHQEKRLIAILNHWRQESGTSPISLQAIPLLDLFCPRSETLKDLNDAIENSLKISDSEITLNGLQRYQTIYHLLALQFKKLKNWCPEEIKKSLKDLASSSKLPLSQFGEALRMGWFKENKGPDLSQMIATIGPSIFLQQLAIWQKK